MNKPVRYDECNCFALRQASRYVTQLYEQHLAPVGVTAAQFTILSKLDRTPGLTAVELADAMVMERTTLVRAIKPLQRDGLIVTGASEHDSRAFVFRLSKAGERAFADACLCWKAAQAEFEEKFGKTRAKLLRSELFDVTKI